MVQEFLYLIEKEDLLDRSSLFQIYQNKDINYYISDDFSQEFYIILAKAGFISTSILIKNKFYLLPEIQFEYAILDFKDLHITKKVQKLIKENNFEFKINQNIELVLENLESYHNDNWLSGLYKKLILELYKNPKDNFEVLSFELYSENVLIAGEIGYKIGKTYTSLSGFSKKDKKYNNWGKLQMILLAKHLEENSFSFWNLGHPYMQYKFDLGAKLYSREDFLEKWLQN